MFQCCKNQFTSSTEIIYPLPNTHGSQARLSQILTKVKTIPREHLTFLQHNSCMMNNLSHEEILSTFQGMKPRRVAL